MNGYNRWDEEIMPQMQGQQQKPAPGLLDRIMSGIKDFTSDEEKMTKLALAANTMRYQPDQGLASVLGSRLKDMRSMKLLTGQANQTASYFRSINREDLAKAVEQNPTMAKEIYSAYLTSIKSGGLTETMQTRLQTIQALGIDPNSEQGRAILSGQDPSNVGKTEREGLGGLRKEFIGIPLVKDFSSQSQALGRIVSSAEKDSPAGDLALIFNYMKMLDPGSTVREGEFATAQNAAGVPERIVNLYNNVVNGTRLNAAQRQDFVGTAYDIYKQSEQNYDQLESQYNTLGQSIYGATEKFLPDFRSTVDVSNFLNQPVTGGVPGNTFTNYVMPSQAPSPNVRKIIETMTPDQIREELARRGAR